ncbi:transglutaminase-like domain-containing protein [Clostridium sp.]|uniref:transglutaminase-like domain-containing protein n=1 Tax=Clostridium sp. TaxID=1506 RepID=UPI00258A55B0|nr:transglutaminase-like domain-containing protein [Clostridium sp.]MDF2505293.1 transglutaminase-like enzyme predicted cysteine protease [Clostridium sp.]
MKLILESNNIKDYLECTSIVDFNDINIIRLAEKLKRGIESKLELSRKAYEYVRDNISHSADINGTIVTCKASQVLKEKQGICFAKSHLLAALLRYLGIPTGFCYQKLILDDKTKPYLILHGLNAVYIEELRKWVRLDSRGNKEGVNAQFSVEEEKLAFPIRSELGEVDIPIIFVDPDDNIINTLNSYSTVDELFHNLPKELMKDYRDQGDLL